MVLYNCVQFNEISQFLNYREDTIALTLKLKHWPVSAIALIVLRTGKLKKWFLF